MKNKRTIFYSIAISEKWLAKNDFANLKYECTVEPDEDLDEEG